VSEGEFQGVKGKWRALAKGYEQNRSFNFVDGGLSIEWMKKQALKFKIY
jgi:hypothetical protein